MESVQVQARWKRSGGFEPIRFLWQGKNYRVETTGRDWEDEQGFHVLVMIQGGQVFELVFQLNPARWVGRPVLGSQTVA